MKKVEDFAEGLGTKLNTLIDELPTPADLMQSAAEEVQKALIEDKRLCLTPSCPGSHINSGKEEDIVPGESDVLEILVTTSPARISHTTPAPHAYNRNNPLEPHKHRQRTAPTTGHTP